MGAPTLYHEETGTITITSDLSFKVARVVWDAIAEKYSNKSLDKQTVRVIDTPKVEKKVPISALEEPKNNPKVETAQKKIKALAPKGKNKHQSRVGIPGWTHEEIDLLNACPDYIEAWVAYQKVFTDRRNKNAVHQRWNKLHPGVRKPGERIKVNEPVKAIALSNDVKEPAPTEPNYKTIIKNSVNPPHEPRIYGAEDLEDLMPEAPTASRAEIRQGVKVKQTGGTKICAGIGTVKRCPNGKDEVLVAFDKGMEWMERKNLTLVPV